MSRHTRVVIVDDEPVIRDAMRELLEADGLLVVGEATNGDEGYEVAIATNPDVVVMDVRMPGGDGITATRRIKAELPDVRVVVLTAYDDPSLRAGAGEAGADAYIVKGSLAESVLQAVLPEGP